METVRYPDEPPVTYRFPEDRYLLETLKYGLNLTIREVYPMLIRFLLESFDVDASEFEPSDLLDVPNPTSRINMLKVHDECERQIDCVNCFWTVQFVVLR